MKATDYTAAAMLKLQRILASLLAALTLMVSVLALTWSIQQRRRAA